ncbi:MAG TPA: PD-(D/E)XK nuclease family protein [Chloroflexia bacterium]|nr:PD-(D/E)XK nuclease family protein [Chloroflexia bacterium]
MESFAPLAAGLLGLVLLIGIAALVMSTRLQQASGLPAARVVYTDAGAQQRATESLFSRRYGLVGKPDYLLEDDGAILPVEVKPTRRATQPYDGDVLQLLAYCLLVEEHHARPPYGLLRYAETTFRIDYTDAARAHLLAAIAEIQAARGGGELDRSHDDARRCAYCMFAEVCDQSLAPAAQE